MTITYDEIRSRMYMSIDDPNLLMQCKQECNDEFFKEQLSASLGYSDFISRTTSIELDDTLQTIDVELKITANELYDKQFILNVISSTIGILWLEPQLKSRVNLSQFFGGKEQKFYAQSSHIDSISSLFDKFLKIRARYIGDNGAYFNSYLQEE